MNNLQKIPKNDIEFLELNKEISASIFLAYERLDINPNNLIKITRDIIDNFKDVDKKDIVNAIGKGSLGFYGKTIKFNTQELCIWIRTYLKENKKQTINLKELLSK